MRAMGVEMNVEGGNPQAIQVLWGKFAFFRRFICDNYHSKKRLIAKFMFHNIFKVVIIIGQYSRDIVYTSFTRFNIFKTILP